MLEFVYQKIPQQPKINTSRALSYLHLPLSAACLPSYVPSVVLLIQCLSHKFTYSVLVFSYILLIPINEMDVFCQVLLGGFNYECAKHVLWHLNCCFSILGLVTVITRILTDKIKNLSVPN